MQNNLAITALRATGIATATQLAQATGKSQATISRMLREVDAQIVRLGRVRTARYAIPESILGLPAQMPLYWDGQLWGTLTFITSNRVHVAAPHIDLVTQGELPWFLDHFRLQGFTGRAWAAKLGFDANPDNWSLAQTLFVNCQHAYDAPGAISGGRPAVEVLVSVPPGVAAKRAAYGKFADDISSTLPAGSSAGGEQPKFLATEMGADNTTAQPLIVKFSPPRGTPFGERWHDLLCAEKIALDTLRAHGLPACAARLVHSKRRTYLESVRFDRIGAHRKLHALPLAAIHRGFVHGPQRNWADSCDALVTQRRLPQEDAFKVRVLLEYGRLIGNTDMHFGNLSLFAPDVAAARFTLAPAYDMLPMCFRPDMHRDELGYTPVTPASATPGHEPAWQRARNMALVFWRAVAETEIISPALRGAAKCTAKILAQT